MTKSVKKATSLWKGGGPGRSESGTKSIALECIWRYMESTMLYSKELPIKSTTRKTDWLKNILKNACKKIEIDSYCHFACDTFKNAGERPLRFFHSISVDWPGVMTFLTVPSSTGNEKLVVNDNAVTSAKTNGSWDNISLWFELLTLIRHHLEHGKLYG